MIRAKHARLIREGIAAAHLPHRLRFMWQLRATHSPPHPLTMRSYRRTIVGSEALSDPMATVPTDG